MRFQLLKETLSHHRGVVFLCLSIFISSLGMGAIAPVLPLFVDQEFHVSRTQVGLAVGLFGMARLITGVPAGYLTQRYGRRFVLSVGTAINLLGAIMVALSFSFTWLVGWRFVSGLGASMYTTGVSVYLRDAASLDNRARFLSLQEMSILVGQSLGPVTGGYLGEVVGLRMPLFLQSALILAALILILLWVPETNTRSPGDGLQRQSQRPTRAQPSSSGALRRLLLSPAFIFVGFFALMVVANR